MSEEKEYDIEIVEQLKRSKEQQGYLEKVKKDQHGNILSGRHRKEADADWPEEVVEVKDELDRELKIIHYNIQRRPTKEETARRLLKVAKFLEAKGISKSEVLPNLAKIVPYTERWVRELLPDEYKRTYVRIPEVERREVGVQRDDWGRTKIYNCALCGKSTVTPIYYGVQPLCATCDLKVQRDPELLRTLKPEKVKPVAKEVKEYKPKETWEHRKAVMAPPVSHMEQRLAKRLTEAGVAFESQKEYCIRKTIPDFVIAGKAFFIDLEALHVKREEKDEEARRRLAQFHNVEPFGLPYKADTKQEEDRLFKQIMDRIS